MTPGTARHIGDQVLAWPGVEAHPHRFGGGEFRLGRRELGHLHGDRIADLPFTVARREELVAAGRARPHHVLPASGWLTVPLGEDVTDVVALFRENYDRAQRAQGRRREATEE